MKVWVVEECLEYEGCEVKAVCKTPEKAEKYKQDFTPVFSSHYIEITEMEVE